MNRKPYFLQKQITPNLHEMFDEKQLQANQQKRFRKGAFVLFCIFILGYAFVVWKLASVQIVHREYYAALANKIHEYTIPLPAKRGNILDRNGRILVSSVQRSKFVAYPYYMSDSERVYVAKALSPVINISGKEILQKLSPKKRYVEMIKNAEPELSAKIRQLTLPQFEELPSYRREYYGGKLAAQLMGYTNIDFTGIAGLEKSLNEYFAGTNGLAELQKFGSKKIVARIDSPVKEPVSGNDVILTINQTMQEIVEKELQRAVQKHKADGGVSIVINPRTGEILAIAQYPFLSPFEPSATKVLDQKLRVVTDQSEPGSVFKIVTAAAAIEYNLVPRNQVFTIGKKYYASGRKAPIVDSHVYDTLSFQHGFEVSSNILMAKVAEKIGKERLFTTAKNLGFGVCTGVDIPGEVSGRLNKPVYWSNSSLSTIAFGYEVSVTPLQVLMAYAAIANDGILMKPYVIKEIRTADGQIIKQTESQVVRQAVSKKTAEVLKSFLEGVVERGTAKDLKVAGIRIAGKTGTAVKNINQHYVKGKYQTMFAGFFPVENPEYATLVLIDNPRGGVYYASQTAAPVFKEIVQNMSTIIGNPRTDIHNTPSIDSLLFVFKNNALAANASKEQKKDTHSLTNVAVAQDTVGKISVPDVFGTSVLLAMESISKAKLQFEIEGVGLVIKQFPLAGTYVLPKSVVKLKCSPERIASNIENGGTK
jgi:cell division protein FtsI/penicillin-binding protein 2